MRTYQIPFIIFETICHSLHILCHCCYTALLQHITPLKIFRGVKMRTCNFKISDFPWPTKSLPNCLYHFWDNLADFLKIMHAFFKAMTNNNDTLDRARTWNFKFSNCQPLLWNCNASPALHLQALSCPLPLKLHCFVQPTLPYLALLWYNHLVISTHLIQKLIKYTTEMWKRF